MPALKQEGSELAIQVTADGRIDMVWGADGNPVFDDTQEFRVTGLLVERRGEWAFDESGERGSRLHTLREDRGERTRMSLQAFTVEALRPAVDGKFIRDLRVTATRAGRRYTAFASWTAGGKRVSRRYEFEG